MTADEPAELYLACNHHRHLYQAIDNIDVNQTLRHCVSAVSKPDVATVSLGYLIAWLVLI